MIKKNKYFVILCTTIIVFVLSFLVAGLTVVSPTKQKFSFSFTDLRKSMPKLFIVESGSMEPVIKTGSLVVSIPKKIYAVGDVITYSQVGKPKDLITHRVEHRTFDEGLNKSPTYITSGDANKDFDPLPVEQERIVGRVVFSVPYVGFLAAVAKRPWGFILLVIVPATIVIYEELKSLTKEVTKETKNAVTKFRVSLLNKKRGNTLTKISSVRKYFSDKNIKRVALATPVIASFLIVVGLTSSFFTDRDRSLNNILGASESWISTPTPTQFITPSLTPVPTGKTGNLFLSDPFTCPGGASNTQVVLGSVTLNVQNNTVIVDATVTGGDANATYDIWVNQDPGGCPLQAPTAPGALTTNSSGNGSAHVETALIPGATAFWISVVDNSQTLRSTSVNF